MEWVVVDLRPRDNRDRLIEQVDQAPRQSGLGLAALAEQDDVLPGQDRVFDLRNDCPVVANDAREELIAPSQPGNEVLAHLFTDRAGSVSGFTELAKGRGPGGPVSLDGSDVAHRCGSSLCCPSRRVPSGRFDNASEEHRRDGGSARDAAPVLMLLARPAMTQGSESLAPVSANKLAIGSCAMRRSRRSSRMRWRRASSCWGNQVSGCASDGLMSHGICRVQLEPMTDLRDGDAVPGWLEPPDAANSPPAPILLIALQHYDELECGRLSRRDVERAPRQRSDKVVNRVGMGCRQQHKTSLRRLQDSADRRSPEIDRQMGTDLVDEQGGLTRVDCRVRQECEGFEAPPRVDPARARGQEVEQRGEQGGLPHPARTGDHRQRPAPCQRRPEIGGCPGVDRFVAQEVGDIARCGHLPARTPPGERFFVSRVEAHTRTLTPRIGRLSENRVAGQSVSILAMYGRSRNSCLRARPYPASATSGTANPRHTTGTSTTRAASRSMSAQVSTAAAPWRRIQAVRKVALSPVLNTSWTRVTDRPAREVVGGSGHSNATGSRIRGDRGQCDPIEIDRNAQAAQILAQRRKKPV